MSYLSIVLEILAKLFREQLFGAPGTDNHVYRFS